MPCPAWSNTGPRLFESLLTSGLVVEDGRAVRCPCRWRTALAGTPAPAERLRRREVVDGRELAQQGARARHQRVEVGGEHRSTYPAWMGRRWRRAPVDSRAVHVLRDEVVPLGGAQLGHAVRVCLLHCTLVGSGKAFPDRLHEALRRGDAGGDGAARADQQRAALPEASRLPDRFDDLVDGAFRFSNGTFLPVRLPSIVAVRSGKPRLVELPSRPHRSSDLTGPLSRSALIARDRIRVGRLPPSCSVA